MIFIKLTIYSFWLLRRFKLIRFRHTLFLLKLLKKFNFRISLKSKTTLGFKFLCRMDEYIEFQIFMEGVYEKKESFFVDSMIEKDWVCIDVGANTGYYSLLLGGKCKTVHAFEPVSESFSQLTENIKLNNQRNIIAYKLGISSRKDEREISLSPDCCGNNSYIFGSPSGVIEKTSLISLGQFVKSYRIKKVNFLKIDVEGMENEVLIGCSELIRECFFDIILIEIKIDLIDLNYFNETFINYDTFVFKKEGLSESLIDHSDNYFFISKSINN